MDANPPPSHSSTYASFPILAISILGILTTAILLLSYYIFVTKCCLNWHHSDILLFCFSSSSSRSRRHQFNHNVIAVDLHSISTQSRGLDASAINLIPTFRFNKISTSSIECAVCISNFQDQELLRILPNCSHSFHIDCIDTWLQSNTNCPLCRAEISLLPMQQFIAAPRPLVQDSHSSIVIEIRDNATASEQTTAAAALKSSSNQRRFWHMKSMGDECIEIREKDERFVLPPIRRSFSMDSSDNRQLYVSVQGILQQNANLLSREVRNGEGSSSGNNGSGRIQRSLFSFGRSFRSSSSVLPLQNDLL